MSERSAWGFLSIRWRCCKESKIESNTKIIRHKQIFTCMLCSFISSLLSLFSFVIFCCSFDYFFFSSSSPPYTDSTVVVFIVVVVVAAAVFCCCCCWATATHRTLPVICVWACVCCHCWKLSENWELVVYGACFQCMSSFQPIRLLSCLFTCIQNLYTKYNHSLSLACLFFHLLCLSISDSLLFREKKRSEEN